MKVLFIVKYPPIEGGVSARTYWLARALGKKGIKVIVVTNSLCVEDMYRAKPFPGMNADSLMGAPKNVFVRSLSGKPPIHIPRSPAYLTRLVNLGLKAIKEEKADLIYANYLEPYAVAGFVLKKMTGLPLVIKHAGSDIRRFAPNDDFKYLLEEVLRSADAIVSGPGARDFLDGIGVSSDKIRHIPYAVDVSQFSPEGSALDPGMLGMNLPEKTPILSFLGKSTEGKGISEFIKALGSVNADFRLLFVSNGLRVGQFKEEAVAHGLGDKFIHIDFVPPWDVPAILRASSISLNLEHNFPIDLHYGQIYEAVACGTPLILSGEIFNKAKILFPKTADRFTVVNNPADINALKNIFIQNLGSIEKIKNDAAKIREEFIERHDWDKYVNSYIDVFDFASQKNLFRRLWPK